MGVSVRIYKMMETLDPQIKEAFFAIMEEMEQKERERVTRVEFKDLQEVVFSLAKAQQETTVALKELAEAQGRTEERVGLLEERVAELAEAQRRTEERVEELAEAQRRTEERLAELAEAQRRTEERVDVLEERVAELAEAQRRTEERLEVLERRMEELAEAQRRTDERMEELAEAQRRTDERLAELAEAQRRTEERLAELAEAQRRTEERVDRLEERLESLELRMEELAEAQRRTEEAILELTRGLTETRKMVGGLSNTVGYALEDRAIMVMPSLLRRRFGMEAQGPFVRRFITLEDREFEINMVGKAAKDGETWDVVGEGKAHLSRKDVDRFLRLVDRLKEAGQIGPRVLPIMATYSVRPAVERYAQERGVKVVWSYELVNDAVFV